MKKSELQQLIKEEIKNIFNENKAVVTPITDFPYLSNKNADNKAVKVDLSDDPEIKMKRGIEHTFVVAKTLDDATNKTYYVVYYQQAGKTGTWDWIQGSATTPRQSGKYQLQGQIIKKIINIARPYLK
jgi:hypothetical protein